MASTTRTICAGLQVLGVLLTAGCTQGSAADTSHARSTTSDTAGLFHGEKSATNGIRHRVTARLRGESLFVSSSVINPGTDPAETSSWCSLHITGTLAFEYEDGSRALACVGGRGPMPPGDSVERSVAGVIRSRPGAYSLTTSTDMDRVLDVTLTVVVPEHR
jgi:hypothetical protein